MCKLRPCYGPLFLSREARAAEGGKAKAEGGEAKAEGGEAKAEGGEAKATKRRPKAARTLRALEKGDHNMGTE